MRVLLDESLPERLRHFLTGHEVATVRWMGWSSTENGKLLDLAESGFDVLLTADQSLPYQQDLRDRQVAVIVLAAPDNQLETLKPLVPDVLQAIETIESGQWTQISTSTEEKV
jgi:predicted nuclease of predicted toxin-antitoxin system